MTPYTLHRRPGWEHLRTITVEIDCPAQAADSVKRGLAVHAAVKAGADLRWANLRGADLSGADLEGANLRGADLRWADLRGADLEGANLSGADLEGANLRGANLRGANLSRANLRWADLEGANLRWADLRGADLRGADLSRANLREANLEGVRLDPASEALRPGSDAEARARLQAVAVAALAGDDTLNMGAWHSCDTTHCIAGWAIHQAGDEGRALEQRVGPYMAGVVLLGTDAAAHFYDATDDARAWLKGVLPQEAA